MFGIFFLLNILSGYYLNEDSIFNGQGVIMIIMVILLSRLFKFVENQHRKINYFLTPANIEEKFTANILISHLYFALLFIVAIMSGYNVGRLIYDFYHHSAPAFYNVAFFNYRNILFLFGIQSIFMFGALFFKKRGVLKTFLCLIGLFVIGVVIVVRLLLWLDFIQHDSVDALSPFIDILMDEFDSIFHIFNYLVIFFFWTLSYFRLKRMEV